MNETNAGETATADVRDVTEVEISIRGAEYLLSDTQDHLQSLVAALASEAAAHGGNLSVDRNNGVILVKVTLAGEEF